ncbi:MAG: phage/plasmid primase, P4 family [Niallia sp.]
MKPLRYIELENKNPIHSFDIFSTDHKNYKNAGIILTKDIVVVDFDTRSKAADYIYNVYPTLKVETTRGFHLWYKRPKTEGMSTPIKNHTDKTTVAGIKVDYKTGTRSQATIKQNGKLRPMENAHYLDDVSTLPELPLLLYPSKLKHDLLSIKEGQGRNSAIYSHLLTTLEQYGTDLIDNETLQVLATFINTQVFAEPLDDQELGNTIKSVLEKKPTPAEQQWLNTKDMVMTSEVLAKRLDLHFYNNQIYFKQNDRYITDTNKLLREIDKHIKLKPAQHKQLMDLFRIKSRAVDDDDFVIQLPNSVIIDDGEPIVIDAGFTPYFLDVAYEENAYDQNVDDFLNFFTCNRPDLRMVIEEMFGHMLMTKGFPHKVFFYQSEKGNNGKSTFLKMLQEFADGLFTNVPLDKFDDDTAVYGLSGKLVNVADDINASYLEKSANFKTLASGDPVMIRPIYSAPITLRSKATLIFTCNKMPQFKDKTGGVARRLVVIPCDAEVKVIDEDLDEKLATNSAKSYILKLALEGIKRIRKNGNKLSDSITIEQQTIDYFIQSDSTLSFLHYYKDQIEEKKTRDVYAMYVAYCEEEGFKPAGSTEFGRRLKKEGWESQQKKIKGNNVRVYQKVTNP